MTIKGKMMKAILLGASLAAALLSTSRLAHAQDLTGSYPQMAPVDQYLMADRNEEIAMARSAAPTAISGDAEVLVLGRHGYETAIKGKNGFVCVVERAWMSPSDAPGFWNPKIRGPICFNPPAARSVLPTTYKRTEMVIAGRTKAEIIEGNKEAFEKGELPPLEPGAMSYMMSKDAYLGGGGNLAHVMVFEPLTDAKMWGAGLPGSTIYAQNEPVERMTIFIVPVAQGSDGTAAIQTASREH